MYPAPSLQIASEKYHGDDPEAVACPKPGKKDFCHPFAKPKEAELAEEKWKYEDDKYSDWKTEFEGDKNLAKKIMEEKFDDTTKKDRKEEFELFDKSIEAASPP